MPLDPVRYKAVYRHKLGHGYSVGVYIDTTEDKIALEVNGAVVERFSASGSSVDLNFSDEARGDLIRREASDWARLAAKTSGQVVAGDGTDAVSLPLTGDVTGSYTATPSPSLVLAIGANKVLSGMLASNLVQLLTGTISAADIVATGAGKLGHANGYPLVAAVGAHNVPEFISASLFYDYGGAGYADGGNITVNLSGGAAQSDPVAAADFCGATADKAVLLRPPTATAGVAMVEDAGLNLVAATAFTNGGSATGVVRYAVMYRVHATGL